MDRPSADAVQQLTHAGGDFVEGERIRFDVELPQALVQRCPPGEHLRHFVREALRAGQRGPLIVAADSPHDGFGRSLQPDHGTCRAQHAEIRLAFNHSAAAVDHPAIAGRDRADHVLLEIAETRPAGGRNDFRNALACAALDLRVEADGLQAQPIRQESGHRALAGAAVADQHHVHNRSSNTRRMTSRGAGRPVHSSNWT